MSNFKDCVHIWFKRKKSNELTKFLYNNLHYDKEKISAEELLNKINSLKNEKELDELNKHYAYAYVLVRDNFKCQGDDNHSGCKYGKNVDGRKVPYLLEIHHINGNHKDNKVSNLILLCANCHKCTENHGHKNVDYSKQTRKDGSKIITKEILIEKLRIIEQSDFVYKNLRTVAIKLLKIKNKNNVGDKHIQRIYVACYDGKVNILKNIKDKNCKYSKKLENIFK